MFNEVTNNLKDVYNLNEIDIECEYIIQGGGEINER